VCFHHEEFAAFLGKWFLKAEARIYYHQSGFLGALCGSGWAHDRISSCGKTRVSVILC